MVALRLSYFLIAAAAVAMVDATAATTTTTRSSRNHPPIHSKFLSHLHCPYAQTWLSVGPERASIELGLQFNGEDEERRRLKQQQSENKSTTTATKSRGLFGVPDPSLPPNSATSKGSCTFMNAFTNTETCTQYHGESWTNNTVDMETYCATASDNTGIYTSDLACT